jgi:hypothetical protein
MPATNSPSSDSCHRDPATAKTLDEGARGSGLHPLRAARALPHPRMIDAGQLIQVPKVALHSALQVPGNLYIPPQPCSFLSPRFNHGLMKTQLALLLPFSSHFPHLCRFLFTRPTVGPKRRYIHKYCTYNQGLSSSLLAGSCRSDSRALIPSKVNKAPKQPATPPTTTTKGKRSTNKASSLITPRSVTITRSWSTPTLPRRQHDNEGQGPRPRRPAGRRHFL